MPSSATCARADPCSSPTPTARIAVESALAREPRAGLGRAAAAPAAPAAAVARPCLGGMGADRGARGPSTGGAGRGAPARASASGPSPGPPARRAGAGGGLRVPALPRPRRRPPRRRLRERAPRHAGQRGLPRGAAAGPRRSLALRRVPPRPAGRGRSGRDGAATGAAPLRAAGRVRVRACALAVVRRFGPAWREEVVASGSAATFLVGLGVAARRGSAIMRDGGAAAGGARRELDPRLRAFRSAEDRQTRPTCWPWRRSVGTAQTGKGRERMSETPGPRSVSLDGGRTDPAAPWTTSCSGKRAATEVAAGRLHGRRPRAARRRAGHRQDPPGALLRRLPRRCASRACSSPPT